MRRKIIKITGGIVLALGVWFFLHVAYMICDGLWDRYDKADIIVVLGNYVRRNGVPSARLKSRLDRAYDLYCEGLAPVVFVSGGIDADGTDEAKAMKYYLFKKGIPFKDIIADNEGRNTHATAINAKKYLDDNNLSKAIVVSQYYHISRVKLAFRRVGIANPYSAHAVMSPELRDFYSVPREFVAYYSYLR